MVSIVTDAVNPAGRATRLSYRAGQATRRRAAAGASTDPTDRQAGRDGPPGSWSSAWSARSA